MTVRELIAKLKTMPPDTIVIYRCCSDYEEMDADDIELVPASAKKYLITRDATGKPRYSDYVESWMPNPPTSEFADMCVFPGN